MPRKVNLRLSLPHSLFLSSYNALQKEPDFFLRLRFNYKYERLQRDDHGMITLMDNYSLAPSSSSCSKFTPRMLANPSLRSQRLHCFLSSSSNLDTPLRAYLTRNIATFLTDIANRQQPLLGFYAMADIEIILQEWVSDALEIIPTTDYVFYDAGEYRASGGLSRLAIERLKKNRSFYYKKASSGGVGGCAICLEEFNEVVKVIKIPCSHIFHEKCIFQWLENRNSCPLCRLEV